MQTQVVSVMMPAYNAEKYIGQAIESVLVQSFQNWELLIVNDGSTDRTPEIIARYPDSRIRTYHQPNGGEASARNTALDHVQGEYLAFLDADDLYLPEHLEVAVTFMQTHPEYDGVYSDGYYINENDKQLKPLSSRRRGPYEGNIFEEIVRASDVFGAPVCVVLRSDLITRYGLRFDTDIVIGPDWDFFVRYAEVARFGYVNQLTCLYRVHQTNISIQTSRQKRLLHLAKCREKTIKLEGFRKCSFQTRAFVFYDLLINLLTGFPERQTEIVHWPEFYGLLPADQAKLLRLMASKAIVCGMTDDGIGNWLWASRNINSQDIQGKLVFALYKLNPTICRIILKAKTNITQDNNKSSFILDKLH